MSISRQSLSQTFSIGLGKACVGGPRQQANAAVSGRQMVAHIAMKMHRPVIQSDVNHIGLRILLLDKVKEAIHLFDVEVIALASNDGEAFHIHAAGNAPGNSRRSCGLGSFASTRLIAASHKWTAKEGELILIEEDHLLGGALSQDASVGNVGHLLIIKRIGRMHMGLPPPVADMEAFEQLADAGQAHLCQPGNHLPHTLQMPTTAQLSVEQGRVVQDLLQVGGRQFDVVVVRGKKRACALFPSAPSSQRGRPVGSG